MKVVYGCYSLHSSIAAYDLYERTARCKFIGQVDLNDLYIDQRRQKILTVTLLQTDLTALGRPKSTQVDLLDPTCRSKGNATLRRML